MQQSEYDGFYNYKKIQVCICLSEVKNIHYFEILYIRYFCLQIKKKSEKKMQCYKTCTILQLNGGIKNKKILHLKIDVLPQSVYTYREWSIEKTKYYRY